MKNENIAILLKKYPTAVGKEHYYEGILKLVKRWDVCMKAVKDFLQ
jgi:hypothetical protein